MIHEYEISNPDAIFGVYAGEDMFLAIGEFCHEAGLELPNNEFAQYGDDVYVNEDKLDMFGKPLSSFK